MDTISTHPQLAITIHKVQGLTLDVVVIDMAKSKGNYQCGQAYVTFNHVKQLAYTL